MAYHYARGKSLSKAVGYLIKSGEKGLKHHALEESRRYFRQAYDLLTSANPAAPGKNALLLEVINRWAFVFYYRGDNKGLHDLLRRHRREADSTAAGARGGMFYAWLGCVSWHRGLFSEARTVLETAIDIGKRNQAPAVIGYANAWLCWVLTELGHPLEALSKARLAQDLWKNKALDHYVYFNSLAGQGYAHWHRGEKKETLATSERLLEFGNRHKNLRSTVLGLCCRGWGQLVDGDLVAATQCFRQAVKISVDPWYAQFPKLALCYGQASAGELTEAKRHLDQIVAFSRRTGTEFIGEPGMFFESAVRALRGKPAPALERMAAQLETWRSNGSRLRYVSCAHILAQVHAALARSPGGRRPFGATAPKNKSAAAAAHYFEQSIDIAGQIGARGVLGRALLNRGLMEASLGHSARARCSLNRALDVFTDCDARNYMNQAMTAINSLRPAPCS